jgi:polyisoprenoid-binding protein YceI
MKYLAIIILAVAALGTACADPAANKPKATTANSAANTGAPEAPAVPADSVSGYKTQGTVYAITPENAKIEFTGSKVTGKHDGGFKVFDGVIDVIGGKPETSRVAFEVDINSIYTDADGLTKHLQTADFFDAEKFPKASFVSTSVTPNATAGADTFMVSGELNMRGMRKSITFPAVITITEPTVNVDADFSVNRKDFGMAYAGKADDLIRDDVVIKLSIKAGKK